MFTINKKYEKLDEALESILADENDDVEYDVVLLPPNPVVVSDEEERNEDDLLCSSLA